MCQIVRARKRWTRNLLVICLLISFDRPPGDNNKKINRSHYRETSLACEKTISAVSMPQNIGNLKSSFLPFFSRDKKQLDQRELFDQCERSREGLFLSLSRLLLWESIIVRDNSRWSALAIAARINEVIFRQVLDNPTKDFLLPGKWLIDFPHQ